MAVYTLVEVRAERNVGEYSAHHINESKPDLADFQGNVEDWSIAVGKLFFPRATDDDSPWQRLHDDGGHWLIEHSIDEDFNSTLVQKCYWKNSENSTSITEDDYLGWLSEDTVRGSASSYSESISIVDFNKPYRS